MSKQIPEDCDHGTGNPLFHGREGRFRTRIPRSALHIVRTKELCRHCQIVFAPCAIDCQKVREFEREWKVNLVQSCTFTFHRRFQYIYAVETPRDTPRALEGSGDTLQLRT